MANAYQYSPDYVRRITVEWQDAIRRDYKHPCVIAWVPMNESWGVPKVKTEPRQVEHLLALYHLTRSLDRSRLVVSNDGWEHAKTDLCTIHDYRDADALGRIYVTAESAIAQPQGRPAYAPGYGYRGEPVLVTEFGGIAFRSADSESWGYRVVSDADELLERYGSLVFALLRSDVVQGFCYTQLTDVEQEINGLLTYDRRPKAELARIREITTAKERRAERTEREGVRPYEA